MPLIMSRVPQEAFLSTECVFRTVGGPLRYRMPQTAESRRALPAANATTARKEKPSAKSTARGAAASKKITAKKFAIPPQICSTSPGRADVAKIHSMPPQKSYSVPRNLRRLLQVESPDPSGVGCGRGLQRPTYTNAERQPQGTVVHRWSGKRGSDPRPQPWQGCALPTELFPQYNPVPRGWDYKGTEFF